MFLFLSSFETRSEARGGASAPEIEVFVEQYVIDKLREFERENDVCVDGKMPTLFENTGIDAQRKIDYIVTLGGDGTILWASKQFHGNYIPPLLCFAHGSLGYLCNFLFDEHESVIEELLATQKSKLHLDNRLRLKADVLNKPERKVYTGGGFDNAKTMMIKDYHVLNEVVIDRGPSSYAI